MKWVSCIYLKSWKTDYTTEYFQWLFWVMVIGNFNFVFFIHPFFKNFHIEKVTQTLTYKHSGCELSQVFCIRLTLLAQEPIWFTNISPRIELVCRSEYYYFLMEERLKTQKSKTEENNLKFQAIHDLFLLLFHV